MGRLLYTAVINNDVPVIQGGILWILTLAVVINTVTDLLYGTEPGDQGGQPCLAR